MRCSMCGMNDCCGADMEQEITRPRAENAAKDARITKLEAALRGRNELRFRLALDDEEALR